MSLRKKYKPDKQIQCKIIAQIDDEPITDEIIAKFLYDIGTIIRARGWKVTLMSGGERTDRHIKLNMEIDGVKYCLPGRAKYHLRGATHVYVVEQIGGLGTSIVSREDAFQELQEDVDAWIKIHSERGTLKEQVLSKLATQDTLKLFKIS